MPPPKDPEKLRIWAEKQSAAAKIRIARESAERIALNQDPFPHLIKAAQVRWANPKARERQSAIQKIAQSTPENIEYRRDALKRRWGDPVERERLLDSRKDMITPVLCESRRETTKKCWGDPEWRDRVTRSHIDWHSIPENKIKITAALKERYKDPDLLERMRQITTKRYEDPVEMMRLVERLLGGFWIGNVRYYDMIYCELWKDVNPRVHAFFDHKCCLCGVPENGHSHIGHHVFYVKKACCWHSEDGVYYTNLNAPDHKEDDYRIGENPNYFVILCQSCHGKTNGKFANRKKWADYFRTMIDGQYNGKCYFTKEEMIAYDR